MSVEERSKVRVFGAMVALTFGLSCGGASKPVAQTAADVTPAAENVPHHKLGDNPFIGAKWYVDNDSFASAAVRRAKSKGEAENAELLQKIASHGGADWVGDWTAWVDQWVGRRITNIQKQGALPLFIVYNLPKRDCGQYSAGGAQKGDAYRKWIDLFAKGIGSRKAVLILEPDGLGLLKKCLSPEDQAERLALYRYAVDKFEALPQTWVYLDAGHSKWLSPQENAERLKAAGIDKADGFALNVSNYRATDELMKYGKEVSALVGGKSFVLDTSRNGNGGPNAPVDSEKSWCNPPGRALGSPPTTETGEPSCQAFLWLKKPGESDGDCNGAPKAGLWYPSMALELAKNAKW